MVLITIGASGRGLYPAPLTWVALATIRPPPAERLGSVGERPDSVGYARMRGTFTRDVS